MLQLCVDFKASQAHCLSRGIMYFIDTVKPECQGQVLTQEDGKDIKKILSMKPAL